MARSKTRQHDPEEHVKKFTFAVKKMDEHLQAAYVALEKGDFYEAAHRGMSDANWALGRAVAELVYVGGPHPGAGTDDLLAAEKRCQDFEAALREAASFTAKRP